MVGGIAGLLAKRAAERRQTTRHLALEVLERMHVLGVSMVVGGSLARDRVQAHSDVDFLILDDGGLSYGRILAEVEDIMRGFPFDLVPLADLPAPSQARMMERTLDASALRKAQG